MFSKTITNLKFSGSIFFQNFKVNFITNFGGQIFENFKVNFSKISRSIIRKFQGQFSQTFKVNFSIFSGSNFIKFSRKNCETKFSGSNFIFIFTNVPTACIHLGQFACIVPLMICGLMPSNKSSQIRAHFEQ